MSTFDWTNTVAPSMAWLSGKRFDRIHSADLSRDCVFMQDHTYGLWAYKGHDRNPQTFADIQPNPQAVYKHWRTEFEWAKREGSDFKVLMLDYEETPNTPWNRDKPGFQLYANEVGGKIENKTRREYANMVEENFTRVTVEATFEAFRDVFGQDRDCFQYAMIPTELGGLFTDRNGHPWPHGNYRTCSPVCYLRHEAKASLEEQALSIVTGLQTAAERGFIIDPWLTVPGRLGFDSKGQPYYDDSPRVMRLWAMIATTALQVGRHKVVWGERRDWNDGTGIRLRTAKEILKGVA